jgi:cellulose synthase/poly-beta-1,6-N-acetylglucosamine synthase-like glycosyltransferase
MPLDQPPKISIIVASRNNEETIDECLKSIFDQDYPQENIEVIVIDGCSTDKTVSKAKNFPTKVFSVPLNAAAAYNYAMNIVNFDILGFVDADAKLEPQWLKKLVCHLEDPKIAGVSGTIETWNSENPWARVIGYEIKNRYDRIGEYTNRIATMNLLMKKHVIEEVGGLDENLPSQYDTDLGARVTAKGFKFAYEPLAKCYHFNRQNLKAYWRQQLQYGKNTIKLYFKHHNLARGDEITDLGMNIQPALLLVAIAFFFIGLPQVFRSSWYVTISVLLLMLLYFTFSAFRVSLKFNDFTAMRLVILFYLRSVAWLVGATLTAIRHLMGKR